MPLRRDPGLPGFTAVLINRSHTQVDLALPIDGKAERLYHAIDGQRTAKALIAASGSHDPDYVAGVLERLWLHDQIAIDASNAVTR